MSNSDKKKEFLTLLKNNEFELILKKYETKPKILDKAYAYIGKLAARWYSEAADKERASDADSKKFEAVSQTPGRRLKPALKPAAGQESAEACQSDAVDDVLGNPPPLGEVTTTVDATSPKAPPKRKKQKGITLGVKRHRGGGAASTATPPIADDGAVSDAGSQGGDSFFDDDYALSQNELQVSSGLSAHPANVTAILPTLRGGESTSAVVAAPAARPPPAASQGQNVFDRVSGPKKPLLAPKSSSTHLVDFPQEQLTPRQTTEWDTAQYELQSGDDVTLIVQAYLHFQAEFATAIAACRDAGIHDQVDDALVPANGLVKGKLCQIDDDAAEGLEGCPHGWTVLRIQVADATDPQLLTDSVVKVFWLAPDSDDLKESPAHAIQSKALKKSLQQEISVGTQVWVPFPTGHGNTAELYQGRVYYIAPQDRDRFKDSLYQCLHVVWYDQNATSLRWEVSLCQTDNLLSPWEVFVSGNPYVFHTRIHEFCKPAPILHSVEAVLTYVKRLECAQLFRTPVDRRIAPQYYVRVKYPIFLDTITKRMKAGEYKGGNASKFWRDLKIMICNTKRFNDVVRCEWRLADMLEKELKRIKKKFGLGSPSTAASDPNNDPRNLKLVKSSKKRKLPASGVDGGSSTRRKSTTKKAERRFDRRVLGERSQPRRAAATASQLRGYGLQPDYQDTEGSQPLSASKGESQRASEKINAGAARQLVFHQPALAGELELSGSVNDMRDVEML